MRSNINIDLMYLVFAARHVEVMGIAEVYDVIPGIPQISPRLLFFKPPARLLFFKPPAHAFHRFPLLSHASTAGRRRAPATPPVEQPVGLCPANRHSGGVGRRTRGRAGGPADPALTTVRIWN